MNDQFAGIVDAIVRQLDALSNEATDAMNAQAARFAEADGREARVLPAPVDLTNMPNRDELPELLEILEHDDCRHDFTVEVEHLALVLSHSPARNDVLQIAGTIALFHRVAKETNAAHGHNDRERRAKAARSDMRRSRTMANAFDSWQGAAFLVLSERFAERGNYVSPSTIFAAVLAFATDTATWNEFCTATAKG